VRTRLLATAATLLLATACGSTVQLQSSATVGGGGTDGLAPGTASGSLGTTPTATGSRGTTAAPVTATQHQQTSVQGPTATAVTTTSSAAQGISMPGVTATSITVGVLAADPSTTKTLTDAGLGAAAVGDEPASWRALADEVNAHGGIAGRKLVLVFYLVNLTDPQPQQGAAACARFTQDHKVAIVLSGYYYAGAHDCLSKKGVPSLLGTNYGVDSTDQRQTSRVVAWATPLLDRLAGALPDAFQQMGKLKRGTAAGLFVTDSPPFTRSAAVLSRELTARGIKVHVQTVKDSASGDYGAAANDGSAAVLKFRSAGVTEVMFLSHNAFEPTVFMQAANAQGYHPTYLLSTQQYPAQLAGLVPAGQLDGSVALGWAPPVDLASGYATSPVAKHCLATLKEHGQTFSSGAQAAVGLLACDAVDLLRRAAGAGLTSRAALADQALSPATGFVSAFTLRTAFVRGRHDGIDAWRPMAFASGCSCYSYTGPQRQLSPR
jgi:ABC-type branched-subunit amino acid transport system substrate-binding protein